MNFIKGQILSGSTFCESIQSIISSYCPINIVEIGTWRGLGSTKCIIDAIIKNNLKCNFLSLESNLTFFEEATINLKDYNNYVNLIYGRIVEVSDVINYTKSICSDVNSDWLDIDLKDMKQNTNVFHTIPDIIDFCLLDGGEYSTYAEWQLLKKKIHIIALDDTKTSKCNLIRQEILLDSSYEIIIDSNERNGFLIAKYNHE
jgi:hypothetical protein